MFKIIHHCSIIGKLIREKSSAELNDIYTIKPWLDEMIDKANQLLNALLRLRKQQMAAEQMLNAHQTSANLDERVLIFNSNDSFYIKKRISHLSFC